MIILDNVSKQYAVGEKFDSFTETIQTLFDTLKETREGLLRVKVVSDELIVLEKEIDGHNGILEDEVPTEELLQQINDAINPVIIPEPLTQEELDRLANENLQTSLPENTTFIELTPLSTSNEENTQDNINP